MKRAWFLMVPATVYAFVMIAIMTDAGWSFGRVGLNLTLIAGLLAAALCLAYGLEVKVEAWKTRAVGVAIWAYIMAHVAMLAVLVWALLVGTPPDWSAVWGVAEVVWRWVGDKSDEAHYLGGRLDRAGALNTCVFLTLVVTVDGAACALILYAAGQFGLGWGVTEPKEGAKMGAWLWFWTQRFAVAPLTKFGVSAFALLWFTFWWADVWLPPDAPAEVARVTVSASPAVVVYPELAPSSPPAAQPERGRMPRSRCDQKEVERLRQIERKTGSNVFSRSGLKDC